MSGSLLLVDDNEDSLDALGRNLGRRGFEVALATSGQAAVEMLSRTAYDLVLLDVMMPGMDGADVLSLLREKHDESRLPVIMVTARSQGEDVTRFLGLGANDYVTKPIDLEVLLARIRTQLRLRRLGQMKDDFLAMASHDLKSPLAAILASAEVLELMAPAGAVMPADGAALIAAIRSRALSMRRLVEDFLDYQVMGEGRLQLRCERVEVDSLLESAVRAHAPAGEEMGVRVVLAGGTEPLGEVHVDPARVAQVLQNLIHNAIKFSEPRSEVVVSASRCDEGVVVTVRDHGPGIPPDEAERVFERYVQLPGSSSRKGAGLGLAIAKRIVEMHHGQIGVRNHPQGGAIFWFRLPLAGVALP